jgi:hypothetical protein
VDLLAGSLADWQLREWAEFFQLEPWGAEMEWYRTGTIAAMIGNTAPNRRRNAKTFAAKDFVPDFQPRRSRTKSGKPNTKALRASFMETFGHRIKHTRKKEP